MRRALALFGLASDARGRRRGARVFALAVAAALAAVLLSSPTSAALRLPLPLLGGEEEPAEAAPDPLPVALPQFPGPSLGPGSGPSASAASSRAAPAAMLAGVAGLVLLAALGLARLASKPRVRKPRKRSFAAGRALGWDVQATSLDDALAKLRGGATPAGRATMIAPSGGSVTVSIERSRREPCALAQGYLTGLFESAWATDALLAHHPCVGKRKGTCTYTVIRSAGPAGGGAIPGSGDAPRRSRPAPSAVGARAPRAPRLGSP